MAAHRSVKARHNCSLVGVITTLAEFHFAARMSDPPDLFELRLDHFFGKEDQLEAKMSILSATGRTRRGEPAPCIITARHPAEGGANRLSTQHRRELLLRFLPRAQYVDVELRSAKALRPVISAARKKNIRCIISFHDFESTPQVGRLFRMASAAKRLGADVFKVATRTDTAAQLRRLLEFIASADACRAVAGRRRVDLALSVMGIGKLGGKSRRELIRLGSVLNYAHLGRANISGQPSLSQLRRWTHVTP
jgi:3-dehydroquinate dehydratase-1